MKGKTQHRSCDAVYLTLYGRRVRVEEVRGHSRDSVGYVGNVVAGGRGLDVVHELTTSSTPNTLNGLWEDDEEDDAVREREIFVCLVFVRSSLDRSLGAGGRLSVGSCFLFVVCCVFVEGLRGREKETEGKKSANEKNTDRRRRSQK